MVTLNTGDHVGPFVLLERLGEGGFAEVWKAERADEPGHVEALKVPNDPEYVKQLRTEDRLRKGLDHPNIVRLLGEDLDSEPPYLRMEYIPGESLEAVLQKSGSLPVKDALDIAEQIGKALAYAHAEGVIHADVKPSNVLIDPEGVARLTDFGLGVVPRDLARSVLKSQAEISNARSRSIVGTLDYMAPEQRAGEPIDARADLYALGRMLYRMLTGSLPTGLRLPSEIRPDLATPVDGLVARLLEDKAGRTPSAIRFLEDLGVVRVALLRPRFSPKTWRERRLVAISVAAIAVAMLVTGIGGMSRSAFATGLLVALFAAIIIWMGMTSPEGRQKS